MTEQEINIVSGKILDSAIEVHRHIGPGLIESIYESCLCKEFDLRKINYKRQVSIPVKYKGEIVSSDLRIDVVVESEIILELKSVETMHPVFASQLLSYLRLADKRLGLLINFNVPKLIEGFKRIVNKL